MFKKQKIINTKKIISLEDMYYIDKNGNQINSKTHKIKHSIEIQNIFDFIKENNYSINLDLCFNDIWMSLFEEKELILTNNIIKFLYYGINSDLNLDIDFINLKKNLKDDLIQHNIEYSIITYKYIQNNLLYQKKIEEEIKSLSSETLIQNTWIILSIKNFKKFIMNINNSVSNEIRNYYITIEELFYDYSKYLFKIKEQENQNLKKKFDLSKGLIIQKMIINPTQIFYIATSYFYSQQNIFKIGGLESIENKKSRAITYNSERPKNDAFYYIALFQCHDYKLVEHFISSYLLNFKLKDKKELYRINFNDLNNIVFMIINQLNEYVSFFNSNQCNYLNNILDIEEVKETDTVNSFPVWYCGDKRFNISNNEMKIFKHYKK